MHSSQKLKIPTIRGYIILWNENSIQNLKLFFWWSSMIIILYTCQWSYWIYLYKKEYISSLPSLFTLLPPYGAQAVIAFRYYYSTLLSYIFQIFSSNLSNPISRGGINWSRCRSNSLRTSHSTKRQDDSSSSSTAKVSYSTVLYYITVYYNIIYVCCVPRDKYFY